VLNLIFLSFAAVLVWRFIRTGGRQMLAMMNGSHHAPGDEHAHHH